MSTKASADFNNSDIRSIHSNNIEEVHNVRMDVIIRPIPPVLDELKVQSLMKTIKVTCTLNAHSCEFKEWETKYVHV